MSTYDGLHVNHSDQQAIATAIRDFETETKKRRISSSQAEWHEANVFIKKGGMFTRYFTVGRPVDGWIEICTSWKCWKLDDIADYMSKHFECKALVLGLQTTVGQNYYRLSEAGACRRKLWYTSGEMRIHAEAGEPLEFEKKHIAEGMAPPQECEQMEDMTDEERKTSLLPDCRVFAEGIGCGSFGMRAEGRVIVIESKPKWIVF